ncbi:MAG: DnaB-like helicase N-terminal domain-containing protein, partial [Spirochaetia bacterium]
MPPDHAETLQNENAEQAVLGAVLIAPEALSVVREKVGADDFSPRNRPIYLGILSLADHGKPADLITLTDELRDRGLLDQCGGTAYISGLTSAIPSAANVAYYADIVQEAAIRRRFLNLSNTIKEQIFSPG